MPKDITNNYLFIGSKNVRSKREIMKVHNQLQTQIEDKFKHDLAYAEYLRTSIKEPSEDELNTMKSVMCKAQVIKGNKTALNNLHYQPLQRA